MHVHVTMTWKDLGASPSVGRACVGCRRGPNYRGRPASHHQASIAKLCGEPSQQRHHVAMSCNCAPVSCSIFPAHVLGEEGALYTEVALGSLGSSSGKARPHEAGKD